LIYNFRNLKNIFNMFIYFIKNKNLRKILGILNKKIDINEIFM